MGKQIAGEARRRYTKKVSLSRLCVYAKLVEEPVIYTQEGSFCELKTSIEFFIVQDGAALLEGVQYRTQSEIIWLLVILIFFW